MVRSQVAPAPFQRCKVLHLTPHVVISNRTGVPVSLRQDGPSQPAPSRAPQAGIMLTAKPHGELLTASPVPEITDSAAERVLLPGMVGARPASRLSGLGLSCRFLRGNRTQRLSAGWGLIIHKAMPRRSG